ncbi:MAG TPA: hypothetical protein VJM53_01165 [Burkholderiales bacterium]|nr:hypothetical protein [Burkholderiales bacterium]
MSFVLRIVIVAVIVGALYKFFTDSRPDVATIEAQSAEPSAYGFMHVGFPAGYPADTVFIWLARCESAQNQVARDLAKTLTKRGIPNVLQIELSLAVPGKDPTTFDAKYWQREGQEQAVLAKQMQERWDKLDTVAGRPIVFVYGRAKGNPTQTDVIAEYRRTRADIMKLSKTKKTA